MKKLNTLIVHQNPLLSPSITVVRWPSSSHPVLCFLFECEHDSLGGVSSTSGAISAVSCRAASGTSTPCVSCTSESTAFASSLTKRGSSVLANTTVLQGSSGGWRSGGHSRHPHVLAWSAHHRSRHPVPGRAQARSANLYPAGRLSRWLAWSLEDDLQSLVWVGGTAALGRNGKSTYVVNKLRLFLRLLHSEDPEVTGMVLDRLQMLICTSSSSSSSCCRWCWRLTNGDCLYSQTAPDDHSRERC